MPSPSDFRKAFGLGVDQLLGAQWRITSSSFGHDVKEQNERYEFPASLEVEWAKEPGSGSGSVSSKRSGGKRCGDRQQELEVKWSKQTGERRLVYSAYGSPYECFFVKAPKVTPLDEAGASFKITALGRAVRRRDIPTLKEARAAERQAAGGAAEVSKEDEQAYLAGCRVIKSRFGTSKCGVCRQTIDPGVKIAKSKGDSGRGGWAHATCLVQQIKSGGGSGGGEKCGEKKELAESSSKEAESGEEAPPSKRRRQAPPAARKGGRSGGSGKSGQGSKAAAGVGSKRSKESKGASGKAGGAGGTAAKRQRGSSQHEE